MLFASRGESFDPCSSASWRESTSPQRGVEQSVAANAVCRMKCLRLRITIYAAHRVELSLSRLKSRMGDYGIGTFLDSSAIEHAIVIGSFGCIASLAAGPIL